MFYLLCIALIAYLYYNMFKRDKFNTVLTSFRVSQNTEMYQKIDKRKQYQDFEKKKKVLDRYIKYNLISQKSLDSMINQLKIIGESNPLKYICDYLASTPMIIFCGIVCLILGKLMEWLFFILFKSSIFTTSFLMFGGIGLIIAGFLAPIRLPFAIANKKREVIAEIEKDYPKLFNHVYYYYGIQKTNYLLSEVLSKFNGNICHGMRALIDGAIEDCKLSEEIALRNIKIKYSESINIVNLADKLQRCIDGFELGPEYLRGLHEQMIAEEDLKRKQSEEKKNEVYTFVMMTCLTATLILQICGVLVEIL